MEEMGGGDMQPVTIFPYYVNGNSVSNYEFSPRKQLSRKQLPS